MLAADKSFVLFSKSLVQVSTSGVDEAHQYMLQQTQQLVAQAKTRGGLKAEVGRSVLSKTSLLLSKACLPVC